MPFQDIVTFVAHHWLGVGLPGLLLTLIVLGLLYHHCGIYTWYGVVLVITFIWATASPHLLYFYVFLLGFVTAFTEILGKFRDEPLKVLKTGQCLIYHIFNGIIAMLAFYMLQVFNLSPSLDTEEGQVKAVVFAGLGAMVIMRSKLFTAKIGDEDVAIGPEQVIKVFFNFMDKGIDRIRAQARIELVVKTMKNIDCVKVYEYSLTMLEAAQTIDDEQRTKLKEEIGRILNELPLDPQLKSYRLGFLLLDQMGENFLTKLFSDPPAAWQTQASPIAEQGALATITGTGEKLENYFAYAQNMSTKKLSQRLNWSATEANTYLKRANPQKAALRGYRLVFNKPADHGTLEGLANIEKSANDTVEGVLYQLPMKVIEFLDRSEQGYHREQLPLVLDQLGKQLPGDVYIAASTRAGLKPTPEYLQAILDGAAEYGLSEGYVDALQCQETLAASTVMQPPPASSPAVTPAHARGATLKYFAYGSNMCTDRLQNRLPSCAFYAVATLPGYVLRFHTRSRDGSGKCNALRTGKPEDQVIGVVFQIAQSEKAGLDGTEGLEAGYHETLVEVIAAGETITACMYEADPAAIDDTLMPYTWYRELVIEGAKEHGLPEPYIQTLAAVTGQEDPDKQREEENSALLLAHAVS